jgi:hypothetical protein
MLLNSIYPVLTGKYFILILLLYANTIWTFSGPLTFCIALILCILEFILCNYTIDRSQWQK